MFASSQLLSEQNNPFATWHIKTNKWLKKKKSPQTKGEEIHDSTNELGENAHMVIKSQVRASFHTSCILVINNKKIVFVEI